MGIMGAWNYCKLFLCVLHCGKIEIINGRGKRGKRGGVKWCAVRAQAYLSVFLWEFKQIKRPAISFRRLSRPGRKDRMSFVK
jgi:hypothetical protein